MSECFITRRGKKNLFSKGAQITDEDMVLYQKGGSIVWGPLMTSPAYSNGYYSHVVTDGNRFYCTRLGTTSTSDYHLMCINPENGEVIWGVTGGGQLSEIDLKQTTVGYRILVGFFGSNTIGVQTLKCYDTNGNYKWGYTATDTDSTTIMVLSCCLDDDGNAYALLGNNYLVKFNSNGEQEWSISLSIEYSKMCIVGTSLYLINSNKISKYDTSGNVIVQTYMSWSPGNVPQEIALNSDKTRLYLPIPSSPGKIWVVDITSPTSGVVDYIITPESGIAYGIAYKNGYLYAGGDLEKYNAVTGKLLWDVPHNSIPNNNSIIGSIAVNDNEKIMGIAGRTSSTAKLLLAEAKEIYTITTKN